MSFARKHLREGSVLAVCALLVLGAGIASSGAPRTGCDAPNLTASMQVIPGTTGGGHIGYRLLLTNSGHSRCRLANQLQLRLLGADSSVLPTYMLSDATPAIVGVDPGHTLTDALRLSPLIPGQPLPPGRCDPAAHSVRVRLEPPGKGAVIGPLSPPVRACRAGTIREKGLR